MKIAIVNSVYSGSTGKISRQILQKLTQEGYEGRLFIGRGKKENINDVFYYGNNFSLYFHGFLSRFFGNHLIGSWGPTKKLIRELRKFNPDVYHIHNIHGYHLNFKMILKFLNEEAVRGKKVIFTLHDAWLFTGHCAYFDFVKCNKWKNQCGSCPQLNTYPKSVFIDMSRWQKRIKSKYIRNHNFVFVSPSIWLSKIAKEDLKDNPNIYTVNNGLDISVFEEDISDKEEFIKKFSFENTPKIILGIANDFTEKRKGFEDFLKLSKKIPDNSKIVLIGVRSNQIANCKENGIYCMERTSNFTELLMFYKYSAVFVNPTYEDNYPTTDIEASLAGLPIIAYDTGGVREQLTFENGRIVEKGDLVALSNAVSDYILNETSYKIKIKDKYEDLINHFSHIRMCEEYIDIYKTESICKKVDE